MPVLSWSDILEADGKFEFDVNNFFANANKAAANAALEAVKAAPRTQIVQTAFGPSIQDVPGFDGGGSFVASGGEGLFRAAEGGRPELIASKGNRTKITPLDHVTRAVQNTFNIRINVSGVQDAESFGLAPLLAILLPPLPQLGKEIHFCTSGHPRPTGSAHSRNLSSSQNVISSRSPSSRLILCEMLKKGNERMNPIWSVRILLSLLPNARMCAFEL